MERSPPSDFPIETGNRCVGTELLVALESCCFLLYAFRPREAQAVLPDSVPAVLTAAVRGFDLVVGAARHVLARVEECASSIVVISVSRSGGH